MVTFIRTSETKSLPTIPPTSSSSLKLLSSATTGMNTLHYNMVNKATWKQHIKAITQMKPRKYSVHYTRHYLSRRVRRSYQQIINHNDTKNQSKTNPDNNDNNNITRRINITEGLTSSTTLVEKSIHLEEDVDDVSEDFHVTDIGHTKHDKKQQHPLATTIPNMQHTTNAKNYKTPGQSSATHTKTPTPNRNKENQEQGSSLTGIVVVSMIAIIISASIFASNLLVIIPFVRCTRIRTPSNYLLFTLSISDFITGLIVIPIVTLTTILRYIHCSLRYNWYLLV